MNLAHRAPGYDHAGYQGNGKMEQEECDKQAVIIGIIHYGIVQDQQEENKNNAQQGCHKSAHKVIQPGPSEYVVIEASEVIEDDPNKRKPDGTCPESGAQGDWNIYAKYLWFNLYLSEHIKEDPGR
jgi:hypothetical protein